MRASIPRRRRVTPRIRRGGRPRAGAAGLFAVGIAGLIIVSACAGPASPGPASSDTAPTVDFGSTSGPTPGMPGGGSPAGPMPAMPGMPGMPAPASAPAAAAPVAANAVQIDNYAYVPTTISVPVGTSVTWTNNDEEPHTVTATDGSFHSPGMGTGATYSYTFTAPGTFDYVCTIHPFMHATVVVTK